MAGNVTILGEAVNDDDINVNGLVKDKMTETSKEVEKISSLSNKEISKIKNQAKNNSEFIDKIIQADSGNIKLAKYLLSINIGYHSNFNSIIFNDTSVLDVLLKNDPSIYSRKIFKDAIDLSVSDYKKNKKIAHLVISNFVKTSSSVLEVESFIEKVGGENKNIISELKKLYQLELKKTGRIYKNDIKKYATNLLNIEDKSILENIFKFELISEKGDINKSTIKKLEKLIQKKITDKTLDSNRDSIINFLLEKIGLNKGQAAIPSVNAFIGSIYDYLNIQIITEEVSESPEDSDTDEEDSDADENNDELLEFCAPDCNMNSSGGSYFIEMFGTDSIEVKQDEYKKFTSKGLENFVNFYKILKEIGLEFLFQDKNKDSFIQLLRNSLDGFDYTSGNGFSQRHITKTLSVIANLIGVPKKMYGEGGKLGQFKDSIEAKKLFHTINGTGIVNGEKVASPGSLFGNGVTEKLLQQNGSLKKNGGLDINRAEEILKEGGNRNTKSDEETEVDFIEKLDKAQMKLYTESLDGEAEKDTIQKDTA